MKWQTEQKRLQQRRRGSAPHPSDTSLCFLWTASSLPGFFSWKDLPSFQDLTTDKTPLGQICLKIITKKIAGTSATKMKSWIRYSLHCFQNYCMFKTSTTKKKERERERTMLRTYIIQIDIYQFQWFNVHKMKSSKQLLTFTKFQPYTGKPNSTPVVVLWLFFNCCRSCSFRRWKKTKFKFHSFNFQLRSTQKSKIWQWPLV